jgi:hypothetical protein
MGYFSATQMSNFTAQATGAIVAIQGITPAAIVGVDLTALTNSQISALLGTQIYALFANTKLSALSTTQLGNFSFDQINNFFAPYTLTSDTAGLLQLNAFSAVQVQALGTNLVIETNHFTPAIVTVMSATTTYNNWMQKLSNAQLAALTTTQIPEITAVQFNSFSLSQMGAFSAAQAAVITSGQFAALTAANIGGITTTAFPSIPAGTAATTTPSAAATFFAAITSVQLGAVTTGQIGVMTPDQLKLLPASAVNTTSVVPSSAQIGVLSTTQVSKLSSEFVDAFSITQLNYFSATQVPYIVVPAIAGLSSTQIAGLSPAFVYALTSSSTGQVQSILHISNTDYEKTKAINVQDLKDHILYLSDAQIYNLSVTQIGNLTETVSNATNPNQIGLLSGASKIASVFTAVQVQTLSVNQFKAINPDEFSKFSVTDNLVVTPVTAVNHIANFKNAAIAVISTAQFAKIIDTNIKKFAVGTFTDGVYTVSTNGDIQSIPTGRISELKNTQLGALTPAQIASLTTLQIAALPTTSTVMSALTDAQIQALHYGETNGTSFYPNQVGSITGFTFDALTTTQMNYFHLKSSGVDQVPKISPSAIGAITPSKVSSLDENFIKNLTGAQLQSMSQGQVQNVTPAYLTNTQMISSTNGFSDVQIGYITITQVGKLKTSQLVGMDGSRTGTLGRLNNLLVDGLKLDSSKNNGDKFPLDATQIGKLSPANVQKLLDYQLKSFDLDRVQALTIADVLPSQIPYIPGNANAVISVNSGTDYAESIAVIDYTTLVSNYYSDGTTNVAVNGDYSTSHDIDVSFFSTGQISGMSALQVQSLTYGQINKFTMVQIRALAIANVLAKQIPYISNISYLSDSQTGNLSKEQMIRLTTTQVAQLSYATNANTDIGGQLAALSEQQMKWFREDVVPFFTSAQITANETGAINKFLSLPNSQYQLFSASTENGITEAQKALETEYQKIARSNTGKINNVETTLTTAINAIIASYVNINDTVKIPDALLHMIVLSQVPYLSAARIATLKQSSQYSLLSYEIQLALDKNILSLSTYSDLAAYINTNALLTSINVGTALYVQLSNLSDALKAQLLININSFSTTSASESMLTNSKGDGILDPVVVTIIYNEFNIGGATDSKIASIPIAEFANIPADGYGQTPSGFANLGAKSSNISYAQAEKMTVPQAKKLTTTSISNLSSTAFASLSLDVLTNLTSTQINAMTEAQMSALTPEKKTILMNIIDGGISALDINLTGFNTSVSADLLLSTKLDAITFGDFDATVTVNMELTNAKNMFQYAHGQNGKIRLYLDKSYFKIKYAYQDSTSITVNRSDSEYSTSQVTYTYPSLKWAGPVTSNDIAGVTNKTTPVSWDFVHYIARKVYGNYAAFAIFNGLTSAESTLRTNMNTQIQTTLSPIITAFDKGSDTGASSVSVTKGKDTNNEYYYELDQSITSTESTDIMSVVFNNLYDNQPARFQPSSSSALNTKTAMPFIAGDALNFIVTIAPHANQKVLDTNTGNSVNEDIPARKYKMRIVIV